MTKHNDLSIILQKERESNAPGSVHDAKKNNLKRILTREAGTGNQVWD